MWIITYINNQLLVQGVGLL